MNKLSELAKMGSLVRALTARLSTKIKCWLGEHTISNETEQELLKLGTMEVYCKTCSTKLRLTTDPTASNAYDVVELPPTN